MPKALVPEEPWFVQAFDRAYLRIYAHRDDPEAESHASQIGRWLDLRGGERVLDVACGAGRYARALARRGFRVTGVDLSPAFLAEARERSPGTPGAPTYVCHDARDLPFRGQFEGAISMFTSFGYFGDREDDLQIMRGVARALVPGGRFLVDYLNEAIVRADLEPVTDVAANGLLVRMERRIDEHAPGGPSVRKHVRAVRQQTGLVEADFEECVRMYTADEIDDLLRGSGFEPVGDRAGDFDGTSFGPDSPRFLRVVRRTA